MGWLVRAAYQIGRAVGYVRERRHPTPAPPKGTRPNVLLHYDGIIYDLSEDLERIEDDERGWAVWRVHGPAHLHMIQPGMIEIEQPLPQSTGLDITLIGNPGEPTRFKRPEEF